MSVLNKTDVDISIVCITFNHAKYIRDAVESFLSQEINNKNIEIIIADDASTDGTRQIIQEYAEKYPGIVALLHDSNVGIMKNLLGAMAKARGKYIALCEGDDFWTQSKKLHLQYEYLESHPDCSVCFHPVEVFFEGGSQKNSIFPNRTSGFTLRRLLEGNYIQTNSVMYRALKKEEYVSLNQEVMPGDWYLHLVHAKRGKIGFINRVMAAYRRHESGVWWDAHKDIDKIWINYGVSHLHLYYEMLKMYGNKKSNRDIIISHIDKLIDEFIRIDTLRSTKLLDNAIKNESSVFADYICRMKVNLLKEKELAANLRNREALMSQDINDLKNMLSASDAELQAIKASKLWMVREMYGKMMRRDMK